MNNQLIRGNLFLFSKPEPESKQFEKGERFFLNQAGTTESLFIVLRVTIAFNTLTEKNEYEILAVFKTVVYTDSPEAFKYYRFTDAQSPEEFDAYIDKCKELSLYDTGVSAEYGDKLITLSTCEYSRTNGRIVVVAKKVTESSGANAPANDGAAEIPS